MPHQVELGDAPDNLSANILLSGEFDVSNVHAFHEDVMKIDRRVERNLVVDCKSLNYIDTAGLQILLTMKLDCESNGNKFEMVEMPQPLLDAMNRGGFNQILFSN